MTVLIRRRNENSGNCLCGLHMVRKNSRKKREYFVVRNGRRTQVMGP